MKHLLDTHVILWYLNGERLSGEQISLITQGENYVSVVSLWEVAIKMNIGKFDFIGGFSAFTDLLANNNFVTLPIKNEHMERLFALPLIHRDPFDRLLIATSIVEKMPIITADENIRKYDVAWRW